MLRRLIRSRSACWLSPMGTTSSGVLWESGRQAGSPSARRPWSWHGRRLPTPVRSRPSLDRGYEQRGCGRSRPLVTEDMSSPAANNTEKLINDIEALRQHLGVDRWLLAGVSGDTTLAVAYAQTHPERVSEMVLLAITLTSASAVEWITEQLVSCSPWNGTPTGQPPIHDRVSALLMPITSRAQYQPTILCGITGSGWFIDHSGPTRAFVESGQHAWVSGLEHGRREPHAWWCHALPPRLGLTLRNHVGKRIPVLRLGQKRARTCPQR